MSTQAVIGYGTLLQRGDGGSPEVFTPIAEVVSLGLPKPVADDVDVTHLTSPLRTKEYIRGLNDNGEFAATINWIPNAATHDETTGLLADSISGTVKNWRFVLPSSVLIWQVPAYVKAFEPDDITADGALRATVTFKVAGASTFS